MEKTKKASSKWLTIGGTLMVGLFVAYLDRSNLSVSLTGMSKDLGFAGSNYAIVSSSVLTAFTLGYLFSNIFGGILTRKFDPKKVVIWMMVFWSALTVVSGFITSVAVLYVFRFLLGAAEGVYWPQQSRFASEWFSKKELSRANSVIQYYGQYLALALGFIILTPIYDAFSWHVLFVITGVIGLLIIVPLYIKNLGKESEAPYAVTESGKSAKLTLKALGGAPFFLILFSYIAQGMLFWGITLWLPTAVKSIGFTGYAQGIASAFPYIAAIVLAVPMTIISDRTGKRTAIATTGLVVAGILLMLLSQVKNSYAMLVLITVAVGFWAASYTPNIWTIIQSSVEPDAVGPASGIINGCGAGGGGTIAGYIVGMLYKSTHSYIAGFIVLGVIVICGGIALLIFGRIKAGETRRQLHVAQAETK